ncbi:hypothetical protein GXW71_33960 [Roseomonas hellenica]|uniref:SRPBCC family protein n=1 Tax=Plastoroseomonas hellenica TaxID=2687306 RepID=A0ABS5FB98_9PROT|nr:hypothetical protein [Plastoroseomonas hellenica]MBR0669405.1 hypothetical protein [Plastoroseomonas hellenica]
MRGLRVFAVLVAACLPTGVSAQVTDLTRSGVWSAFMGHAQAGTRVCGAGAPGGGEGIDQASFLIKHFPDNSYLNVQIIKLSWNFPAGTRIRYELLIDGRRTYVGRSAGIGNVLEWIVTLDRADEFVANLTGGRAMELRFLERGEPPIAVSLSGTEAVLDVLARCISLHTRVFRPAAPDAEDIVMQHLLQ